MAFPKKTFLAEHRVAIVPAAVADLFKAGLEVTVESAAGLRAGFPDDAFRDRGARVEPDRDALFSAADVVLQVRTAGAGGDSGRADFDRMRQGQVVTSGFQSR